MRQIILDTETTGIDPKSGHRVIEMGCVELIDRKLTGATYHAYLNPERKVDEGAFRVHGISDSFLQDKPLFKEVVSEFLEFIQGAELIIHNAPFDVGFLNAELKRLKWKRDLEDYCAIFDTLDYARKKHPGQKNNLDALCKRYEVNNSNRQLHGALLDAEILALVYLAMTGGQTSLFSETEAHDKNSPLKHKKSPTLKLEHPVLVSATDSELEQHQEFVEFLVKKSGVNHWE